ncbi:ATP-dependent DNA/RNA helicase dhx36 [Mactra antiquata]
MIVNYHGFARQVVKFRSSVFHCHTIFDMYQGRDDDNGRRAPYRGGYRHYGNRGGGRNRGRDHRPHSSAADYGSRHNGDDDDNGARPRSERRGPPRGLRGRDIGMYYARKGQERRKQIEKDRRPEVKFDGGQERNIRRLLDDIKSSRECPSQPSRSYADLSDDSDRDGDPTSNKLLTENLSISVKTNKDDYGGQYHSWSNKRSVTVKGDNPVSSTSEKDFTMNTKGDNSCLKQESSVDETDDFDNEFEDDFDIEEVSGIMDALQQNMDDGYLENSSNTVTLQQHSDSLDTSGLDEKFYKEFMNKQNDNVYLDMMKFRKKLPSYDHAQAITDLIASNQVVVLSGETGCGKTTQVPQFILDDYIKKKQGSQCRIICTQPRRISAISVAERVSAERAEKCGHSAGYMIRLENKLPRTEGSILYCTTGILLKVLEDDPLLHKATHIILDEIHERDLLSDFLIIILRDVLKKRKDLKVILMSATLNAEAFSKYFDNCPMYNIPGFTFPVEEFYLEDTIELLKYEVSENEQRPRFKRGRQHFEEMNKKEEMDQWLQQLWNGEIIDKKFSYSTCTTLSNMNMDRIDFELVSKLIKYIVTGKENGAILIFMPGWMDISSLHKTLTSDTFFRTDYFKIIPLHSMMPTINQREVFERPKHGVKIIIATNIAETSITIDDVLYVIDCGRIKVKGFTPENNLSTLNSELVSLANARQRRGRAGRVQAGECYHLYTRLQESKMLEYLPPEMLRTRLEELCLQIKYLKLGSIVPFVSKAMEPPSMEALNAAIVNLQRLNALDKDENLLPLGKHLARMPLDPHTGKMILFGAMFGCLDPILTIAATLNFKDPFFSPLGKEKLVDQRKQALAKQSYSDHILLVNTYNQWERCLPRGTARQFCNMNFLSESTLRMLQKMRGQLAGVLCELGFLSSSSPTQQQANQNSGNEDLIKAIVCAGLYPNIAKITKGKTKHRNMRFITEDETKCELHPKSVANDLYDPMGKWIVYHQLMKTANVYIYDLSVISPYSLLFFGGNITQVRDDGVQTVCVDDWIRFKASSSTVDLVKELRQEMDLILENKICDTKGTNWGSKEGAIIRAIIDLITTKDNSRQ